MASQSVNPKLLASLQTEDHGNLLDVIDQLRSQGITQYIDLPQIIVCGDQSSGKSSVLEALSRVKFPTKDNLCTRFATELVLRRSAQESVNISIIPGPDRTEKEKQHLLSFAASDVDLDAFGDWVEAAKVKMGVDGSNKAFSFDTLRVEINGPTRPQLTLVDLPGLFQAGNKSQSEDDAALVKKLVLSYMEKTRSVILAVVSAKNDFANQIVTKYARELDPTGQRTLGLITKPDTLHAGSDSELSFLELAANKDVHFRLGWHVIKNRDYDNRECSDDERDRSEAQFFSQRIWKSLPPNQLGIFALSTRLSMVLKDQILSELPGLISDVQKGLKECERTLERLGTSRNTVQEQRAYLVSTSLAFSSIMKAAIDGIYSDHFFGSALSKGGYQKRLRARMQNLLIEFAKKMRLDGHAREIIEEGVNSGPTTKRKNAISKSKYINEVRTLLRRSRGRELPGTFNPLIIGDLFYEQAKPWRNLANRCTAAIRAAVASCIRLLLNHLTDAITADRIFRQVIRPALKDLDTQLDINMAKIMAPHVYGHPITYNHYLIENIQKAKERHQKAHIQDCMRQILGPSVDANKATNYYFQPSQLVEALSCKTEAEMDTYSCSEAIDCMQAYYKVAMKTFIDDYSVLGIENSLIQNLPNLFSPSQVTIMEDEAVMAISSESAESATERYQTLEKLDVIKRSLALMEQLDRYRTIHSSGMRTGGNPAVFMDAPSSNSDFTEESDQDSSSDEMQIDDDDDDD